MYVLAMDIELRFPASRSLKEKRARLRPILDGMRSRFDVSVAEVDHHDTWQRCRLGVALVSGENSVVEQLADKVERFVWQAEDTEVVAMERHWLDIDR